MRRITERKAKETIQKYLEGNLSQEQKKFHIVQPYLFEYIYLIQTRLDGEEREILRTLATMIYCVMNELGEVPLVTRNMIIEAVRFRDEINSDISISENHLDDMRDIFPQSSLYSSFSTFLFSFFLRKKTTAFTDKEKNLIGILLSEMNILIMLFDNKFPHTKISNEFIAPSREDFDRIANIGRIIIQPLFDQFSKSEHFLKLNPHEKDISLTILSRYAGMMAFLYETAPHEWETDPAVIFFEQLKIEMDANLFEIQRMIFISFFRFMSGKDILPNAEKLLEVVNG